MDNFLEINDERQSEAPSSDFSSSEIPTAPKEQWRTIHGDWLEYRNVNGKFLCFVLGVKKLDIKIKWLKDAALTKKI
ncbi:unnamed protein product [Rhizophagus irregularis]|nr:unnamed protein product [Rhizophagus irregularis]